VGSYAVQFARQAGVRVLVTAQGHHADLLRSLGADKVIDYKAQRFEDVAKNVDLVFDLVGGETLDRSWQVLSPQGRIVSIAAPDIAARVPEGRQGAWFTMHADGELLSRIAAQAASGELAVVVADVVAAEQAPAAIERNKTGHGAGKTVVRF
jgi:N-ethylmaleimide reductase